MNQLTKAQNKMWTTLAYKQKSLQDIRDEMSTPAAVKAATEKAVLTRQKSIDTATKTIIASGVDEVQARINATKWYDKKPQMIIPEVVHR